MHAKWVSIFLGLRLLRGQYLFFEFTRKAATNTFCDKIQKCWNISKCCPQHKMVKSNCLMSKFLDSVKGIHLFHIEKKNQSSELTVNFNLISTFLEVSTCSFMAAFWRTPAFVNRFISLHDTNKVTLVEPSTMLFPRVVLWLPIA